MKIAITGARGFVGKNLIEFLLNNTTHNIVALSRKPISSSNPRIEHRVADFYSLKDSEEALKNCDIGIYLIHSMLQSNRLNQGSFEDYDYLLADNFARAAKTNSLKQIVYVSGIVPRTKKKLSTHLKSRVEVENVLASTEIPLTVLRSSLIIGPLGSSFILLKKLVYRLPSMGLPAWANTPCQPIFIDDLIYILNACIDNSTAMNRSFDCGSPEVLSYKELIATTAKAAHLKRKLINLPNIPVWFSKLWIRLITGASKSLVYPLVDSLTTPMTVNPKHAVTPELQPEYTSILKAITVSLPNKEGKKKILHGRPSKKTKSRNEVRSIQRLPLPRDFNAHDIAKTYTRWLPKAISRIIVGKTDEENVIFKFMGLPAPLLHLKLAQNRSTSDRQLFYITGGLLVKKSKRGRLEFRESYDKKHVFAAIHDYKPSLPWWIYLFSQAIIHKIVMSHFGKHLKNIKKKKNPQENNNDS